MASDSRLSHVAEVLEQFGPSLQIRACRFHRGLIVARPSVFSTTDIF
jgi:hypothetical protein